MFSGLWLLVIVLIAHGVGYVPLIPNVLALGALGLLWGGHILAPVIVIWTNRAWRADMVKNKRQCILLPLSLLLMSITLGMLGDVSQWPGLPREITFHLNPRLGLFYMFLLWNTWHFSAQHFGVLAIYRRLSGQFSKQDRCLDRAFCVGMTCVLSPMAWYAQHRKDHLGQLFLYLPNPSVLPELGTAIIVTSAFLTLLYMTIESLKQHASLPRGLYILSIGIQPIFGTISYPIYHIAVFGICHWLIEFALASRMLHSPSLAAESRLLVPPQRTLRPGFSTWALVFTLLSVLMYCIFHGCGSFETTQS